MISLYKATLSQTGSGPITASLDADNTQGITASWSRSSAGTYLLYATGSDGTGSFSPRSGYASGSVTKSMFSYGLTGSLEINFETSMQFINPVTFSISGGGDFLTSNLKSTGHVRVHTSGAEYLILKTYSSSYDLNCDRPTDNALYSGSKLQITYGYLPSGSIQ